MKRNRIYGPRSASEGNNWDDGSCNVSLNSLDVMTMLYKLTTMTWTHGKTGKYDSGGLVFRYRRYRYTTDTLTSTMITLGPSLMGLGGTQVTGSIIYTLVSSPRDSTRIVDSGWISNLHIFDLINLLTSSSPCTQNKQLSLYCLARGFG
jgi:hypothetical protein